MNYQDYSASDFARDEHFIKWVKSPDRQTESFWQEWLWQHPEKQFVIDEARQLVESVQFQWYDDTAESVKSVWERIQTTTISRQPIVKQRKTYPLSSSSYSWNNWQKIAAVFVGTLLISAILFLTVWKKPENRYSTSFGETKLITLPDSSTVLLNANSTLAINNDWENGRKVWLKGEAFFSVRKKKDPGSANGNTYLKFTVHTNNLQINVLGTEFNVSDRKQHTVVVLNSGKIQLSLPAAKEEVLMQPGDLVEVSNTKQQHIKKVVNPQIYSAWTKKEWVLDNLTLGEVGLKIEETFGVKVIFKNTAIAQSVVTGNVPTDNLTTLLDALSATFDIDITQKDKHILIE